MKRADRDDGYNERLFSGGLRRHLHMARFYWLARKVALHAKSSESVLELGCFDGKAIEFLPTAPTRYVGFDANWEGGLDLARERWRQKHQYAFRFACSSEQMDLAADERFDVAIAMETLEHVPPTLVDGYLAKIAEHLDGKLFVTIPNEKGLVFLSKYAAKRVFGMSPEMYSVAEILNATLGRMSRVVRREHKGFDYVAMIKQIEIHFRVLEVSGIPFGEFLPSGLCFGVGIVAQPLEAAARVVSASPDGN
jgi:2-polyprenyl-3-methyl-5-hydroxy-6-metoxy-1,4-benzoquinol methylase